MQYSPTKSHSTNAESSIVVKFSAWEKSRPSTLSLGDKAAILVTSYVTSLQRTVAGITNTLSSFLQSTMVATPLL